MAHGMNLDVSSMLRGWTVASFDRAVTLQALGYPAAHHYYRHACSTNYLPHVRTPTLILASRDDPFLG
jgi:predicted alpha/beta-fold hydrolase